jgi:Bacterial nucleoid DNA-binding protein
MNNKELIAAIAAKNDLTKLETENILEATVAILRAQLAESKSINVYGFGNLEIRKKEERISVHPQTKARILTPPKLVVNFKQSTVLKNKLNNVES